MMFGLLAATTILEMRAPPSTVPLLPAWNQVLPPSTDLNTPTPGRESKAVSATPVPANITILVPLVAMARPPMGAGSGFPARSVRKSIVGFQLLPPSVVFHTPPLAAPTKYELPLRSRGSVTTTVTRPDTLV